VLSGTPAWVSDATLAILGHESFNTLIGVLRSIFTLLYGSLFVGIQRLRAFLKDPVLQKAGELHNLIRN
jgi:hypothetical protein